MLFAKPDFQLLSDTPCDRIAKLFKSAREDVFLLSPSDYYNLCSLTRNNFHSLERLGADRPVSSELTSKVFATWQALPNITDAQRQKLLEIKNQIIDQVCIHYGGDTYGLLYSWLFEFGTERFKSVTKLDAAGISNSRIKAREYDFSQLCHFAKKLFDIPDIKPNLLWNHPILSRVREHCQRDAETCGRPSLISELHMKVACCGGKIASNASILPLVRIPYRHQAQLAYFRYVSWPEVEPIVQELAKQKLFSKKELTAFQESWQKGFAAQSDTFPVRLHGLMEKRNLTPPFLAECLGMKESLKDGDSDRLFKYLRGYSKTDAMAFAPLAYLVAGSQREAQALIQEAREEMLEELKRNRSSKKKPALYVERMIWGVDKTDLKGVDSKDYMRFEDGLNVAWNGKESDLLAQIREVGQEKLRVPLERWIERSDDSTVQGFYRSQQASHGVKGTIHRLCITHPTLTRYLDSSEVPSKPTLISHIQQAKEPLKDAVQINWYDQYAKFMRCQGLSDLARIFASLIAAEADSNTEFLRKRSSLNEKNSESLYIIQECGYLESQRMKDLLKSLGITNGPLKSLIDSVNSTGSIAASLPKVISQFSSDPQFEGNFQAYLKTVKRIADPKETTVDELIPQKFGGYTRNTPRSTMALAFASALPGVTQQEIINFQKTPKENSALCLADLYRQLKIDSREVGYLVESNKVGRSAFSNEAYAQVMKTRQLSRLVPPALICALLAPDYDHFLAYQEAAYDSLKAHYSTLGITATQAQLAVAYYGIDPTKDLHLSSHQILKGLKSNAVVVQEAIEQVGRRKIDSYLHSLNNLYSSNNLQEVYGLYAHALRGRQWEVNTAAGINNRLQADYAKGEKVPALPRFQKMLKAIDFPIDRRWKIAWQFEYAELLSKRNLSLLTRHLLCRVAAADCPQPTRLTVLRSGVDGRGVDHLERIALLQMMGLEKEPNAMATRAINQVARGVAPSSELLAKISSFFGDQETSIKHKFLMELLANASQINPTIRNLQADASCAHNLAFEPWYEVLGLLCATDPAKRDYFQLKVDYTNPHEALNISRQAVVLLGLLMGSTREEFFQTYQSNFYIDHLSELDSVSAKIAWLQNIAKNKVNIDLDTLGIGFGSQGPYVNWIVGHYGLGALLACRMFTDPGKAINYLGELTIQGFTIDDQKGSLASQIRDLYKRYQRPVDVDSIGKTLLVIKE